MSEIVGTISKDQTATGNIGTVYGKDGLSAYQIALKNGFIGTEKEWLESLHGQPGYTPVRGVDYWTKDDIDEIKSYVDKTASGSIVNEASGSVITLKDASDRALQGLKIYGNYTEETGVVGQNGSVTINVTGKNLFQWQSDKELMRDYSNCTLIERLENGVIVQGYEGNTPGTQAQSSGHYYPAYTKMLALKKGDVVTISADYTMLENAYTETPTISIQIRGAESLTDAPLVRVTIGGKKRVSATYTIKTTNSYRFLFTLNSGKVRIENVQVEYGSFATNYETYRERILTVPTPNGLDASGGIYDEIDFGKGVYIKRVGVDGEEETPLPDDVLAAYANLHTFKPNSVITNDYAAEMSVEYVADTKAYIDNKFTELQNAILASGANV